jgi:hypothetical protein
MSLESRQCSYTEAKSRATCGRTPYSPTPLRIKICHHRILNNNRNKDKHCLSFQEKTRHSFFFFTAASRFSRLLCCRNAVPLSTWCQHKRGSTSIYPSIQLWAFNAIYIMSGNLIKPNTNGLIRSSRFKLVHHTKNQIPEIRVSY